MVISQAKTKKNREIEGTIVIFQKNYIDLYIFKKIKSERHPRINTQQGWIFRTLKFCKNFR